MLSFIKSQTSQMSQLVSGYNCAIGSCHEHQWPVALELAFGPRPDRKHDLVQTTQLVTLLGESYLTTLGYSGIL